MENAMILTPVSLAVLMGQIRDIFRDELRQQKFADLTEKLLTPKEAAELLRISTVTLWQWEKQGRLTKYTMGGRTYFKYGEVIDSLETLQRYHKPEIRRAAK